MLPVLIVLSIDVVHAQLGPGTLDHFLCYKTKFKREIAPDLADAFDAGTHTGKQGKLLCTPADKNGEGVGDEQTHLAVYKLKGPHVRQRDVAVANQFDVLRFDTKKADSLMIPTAKTIAPVPPPALPDPAGHDVDHYRCLKGRRSGGVPKNPPRITVAVADQLGTRSVAIRKPSKLCVPTDKNGEGIKDPTAHLLCYKAKPDRRTSATGVQTSNQFGADVLVLKKELELCVPSWINPVCGDNVHVAVVEECDGADDANCPGLCTPGCACPGLKELRCNCADGSGPSLTTCNVDCFGGAWFLPLLAECPTACNDATLSWTGSCLPARIGPCE